MPLWLVSALPSSSSSSSHSSSLRKEYHMFPIRGERPSKCRRRWPPNEAVCISLLFKWHKSYKVRGHLSSIANTSHFSHNRWGTVTREQSLWQLKQTYAHTHIPQSPHTHNHYCSLGDICVQIATWTRPQEPTQSSHSESNDGPRNLQHFTKRFFTSACDCS